MGGGSREETESILVSVLAPYVYFYSIKVSCPIMVLN